MNPINERIIQVMHHYNFNPRSFSKNIGVNYTTMSMIINGKIQNPTYNTIMKIVDGFTNISLEWFFRGNGEMLIEKEETLEDEMQTVQSKLIDLEKRIEALENKSL